MYRSNGHAEVTMVDILLDLGHYEFPRLLHLSMENLLEMFAPHLTLVDSITKGQVRLILTCAYSSRNVVFGYIGSKEGCYVSYLASN